MSWPGFAGLGKGQIASSLLIPFLPFYGIQIIFEAVDISSLMASFPSGDNRHNSQFTNSRLTLSGTQHGQYPGFSIKTGRFLVFSLIFSILAIRNVARLGTL